MVAKFGRYELIERISLGGMAEVFKGRSSGAAGFEKIVAIKRILPHLSDDRDFISMFIDEAKLSANLNHSNIGQVFEFGKIDEATGLQQGSVGAFIGAVLNFLIVALVLFSIVKAYNRFRAEEEEAPAVPPEDTLLLREIRDSLQRAEM